MPKRIGIIGGGASGVFAAILLAERSDHHITIYEKTDELLKKVKISGGGRCNVTHHFESAAQFSKNYPRGSKILKKNLHDFSPDEMKKWLESRGVKLKTESDGRVFPVTDDSETIIALFLRELHKPNITLNYRTEVLRVDVIKNEILVETSQGTNSFDNLILAMGGPQKERDMDFVRNLGVRIIPSAPSLFTFKIQDKALTELMGLSVQDVGVKIQGTKFQEHGPVLITHWGLSGPGILKLSAWGAFHLQELHYHFNVQINWLGSANYEEAEKELSMIREKHTNGKVANYKIEKFPQRFWEYLLHKSSILSDKKWNELSKKEWNKLIEVLVNTSYEINGKTTYKEEFVTAGGIDTDEINTSAMSLKKYPNIYAIGEVTNIDGITGGFNFQNCWTGAWVCSRSICNILHSSDTHY